jgi:hypothetical protein
MQGDTCELPKEIGRSALHYHHNTEYHWRFSPGDTQSTLVVYGPVSGRQSLSVALLEWRDQWLAFPEPTGNQPKTIGPSCVRKAIEFG